MDPISSPPSKCPLCGKPLPEDVVGGCCPHCLMAGAMQPTHPGDQVAPLPILTPEELAPLFPQLEVFECLGRGGMGVVYKARQKSLNRFVALKLLAPERANDPQFAARFEKEAQALAALNHPHIVGVYDFGQAGGFYFLLMEFVDGVNLRQLMQAKKLTPTEALSIVPPVCEALQCAHDHGIVHRDIKPENLMLDKAGVVKIADFGIAKMLGARQTDPVRNEGALGESRSQLLGTPDYAAPEQRDANGEVDHRADIYSLGVVLYEMLTGERPKDKIEAPSKRVQVDIRIDEIVMRALEKHPEMRFPTAAEFRTRVEAAAGAPMSASPVRDEDEPMAAVRAWLLLLDKGEYAESRDAASAWFKGRITREKWVQKCERVRTPLGKAISREQTGTRFAAQRTRFEAQFETGFHNMPGAVETVMFIRKDDGAWKATGYLIRPASAASQAAPGGSRDARSFRFWLLMLLLGIPAFCFALLFYSWSARPSPPTHSLPLPVAVNAFNARYANDPIGQTQPPLTVDEVLADIRSAMADRDHLLVSDETLRQLGQVVETRRLPDDFEFEALTSFDDGKILREAWSVRLRIPGGTLPGGTTCIMIRDKEISSRPVGPRERALRERWWKDPGSFQRTNVPPGKGAEELPLGPSVSVSRYDEELKAAIAQDAAERAASPDPSTRNP